jgi:hypothetical protein
MSTDPTPDQGEIDACDRAAAEGFGMLYRLEAEDQRRPLDRELKPVG